MINETEPGNNQAANEFTSAASYAGLENTQSGIDEEIGEKLPESGFNLQTPQEFRDNFVDAVSKAKEQVGLETMQFEAGEETAPIFAAIQAAERRGVNDVRFHYDRVALKHVRAGDDEAFVVAGRTVMHRGDKPALKQAHSSREQLLSELEASGISSPSLRKRGTHKRLSHNHAKLAIADDVAWFGTMNFRESDFRMSNFMLRVDDPYWVGVLKEIFNQTEATEPGSDKVFQDNEDSDTALLLDAGVKNESIIYDKAVEMANSLQQGDEFIMISQWTPIKVAFGALAEILQEKLKQGVAGTFLLSPEQDLHPSRRVAHYLQRKMERIQQQNPSMTVENLPRQTHAKAFLVKRANGSQEVLFGSHNFTSWTVRNGTRELAMWSRDPAIIEQLVDFLGDVRRESSA
jgi:hypothetical protein